LRDCVQNCAGDLVEDLSSIRRHDNDSEMRSGYIVGRRNSGIGRNEYVELLALRSSQQLPIV